MREKLTILFAVGVLTTALVTSSPATATSHTTDPRCDQPGSGSVYRECLSQWGLQDDNDDGVPNGGWIRGVEQSGDGFQSSEYEQWVVDSEGLSKHMIIPPHSPAVADVGIVRSFPVWNTGEVYQACALAKVYDQVGESGNEMNFVARLTVAQKQGHQQVGAPEEHNAKIQAFEGDLKEFATAPFKINSSSADNIAVKFRAHSDTRDAGGVAVLHSIKFLRFANGSSRTQPVDCYPNHPTASSIHRNP